MSESVTIRRLPDGTKINLLGQAQREGYPTLESWLRHLLTEHAQPPAPPLAQPEIDPAEYESLRIQSEIAGQRWRSIRTKLAARRGAIQNARQEVEDGKGGRLGSHVRTLLQLIDEVEQEVS
jgi:hypothetical protein